MLGNLNGTNDSMFYLYNKMFRKFKRNRNIFIYSVFIRQYNINKYMEDRL